MEKKYTLDELESLFEEHSKEFWERQKDLKEKNPFYIDYHKGFCICDAFLSIVREIKELKNKMS